MQIKELNIPEDRKSNIKKRYFSNEELVKRYSVYMRKRNLSVSTIETRSYLIESYFTFIQSINVKTIYKLNGDTLGKYLEYLKQQNYTVLTQELKLKALKAFYVWLKEEEIIDTDNEIFNGFCIFSYIRKLEQTFIPQKQEQEETAIRREMSSFIDKFISYYLNKGYSQDGTAIYKRELKRFVHYLEEYTGVNCIKEVTKNILAEYQIYVSNLKREDGGMLSLSSKQKKLVVIRRFFKFLTQYDYIDKDPSTVIELPRVDRGLPTPIMNERELEIFFNAPDLATAEGIRDRAIMEVLYSTGIRNSELCYLKIEDINFEDGFIKITHPKGGIGYQRVVPIGKVACHFVRKYIEESRPQFLKEKEDNLYLFLNNFGGKMRKGVLIKYMKTYRFKANIRNKISAHSFRVTCATSMLKNGADVRYIQEQLGHRSLRSTQIYTRVYPKDLKKIHSQTHPREKTYKNGTVENTKKI